MWVLNINSNAHHYRTLENLAILFLAGLLCFSCNQQITADNLRNDAVVSTDKSEEDFDEDITLPSNISGSYLTGVALDVDGISPVQGATVYIDSDIDQSVITDKDGSFRLPVCIYWKLWLFNINNYPLSKIGFLPFKSIFDEKYGAYEKNCPGN